MATNEDHIRALEEALEESKAKEAAATNETTEIAAVSLKLPPFWSDKTDFWFALAEAQFAIKNITTNKTKYSYVVTMLDSKTAAQAMDIIKNPPVDAFEALKTRLTNA